jgi:hypothetical protein
MEKESLIRVLNGYLYAALTLSVYEEMAGLYVYLEEQFSITDFDKEQKKIAAVDIKAFVEKSPKEKIIDLDLEQLGYDFWLTRNKHGEGFWSGDYEENLGQQLTSISHDFNEVSLKVSEDKKLYFSK